MLRWQTNAAAIVAFACLVLGFASIEALQRPHSATHSVSTGQKAKAEEEDPEVATARYTKWLMVCTGVLAFATICLGLATLGLYLTGEKQIAVARQSADAAKQSADASQNAAEHIPRVERAYIFADVLYEYRQDAGAFSRVPTDNIIVCLSNYGKTPGEVSRVAISYCSYLPKSPDYSDSDLHVGIWVKAGAENVETKIKRSVRSLLGKPIIYGRIYYRDIFGTDHSSGFAQTTMGSQIASIENAPPEFTSWD